MHMTTHSTTPMQQKCSKFNKHLNKVENSFHSNVCWQRGYALTVRNSFQWQKCSERKCEIWLQNNNHENKNWIHSCIVTRNWFSKLLWCKNKAKTIPSNFMHYVSICQIFHNSKLFTVNKVFIDFFWKLVENYPITENCWIY